MIDSKIVKKQIFPILLCIFFWGITIILTLINAGSTKVIIAVTILITVQMAAAVSDIYNRIIPFKLTLTALCIGLLICIIFYKPNEAVSYLIGGVAAFFIMKLLVFFSKDGIGGGDLALMTITGLFAGIDYLLGIFFAAVLLTGIYSLIMILIKRADKKTEIPFAPFVLIATSIMLI